MKLRVAKKIAFGNGCKGDTQKVLNRLRKSQRFRCAEESELVDRDEGLTIIAHCTKESHEHIYVKK